MLDSETKRRIDTCRDILVGKVPDPKSQVEQITVALIYKFMDDMDLGSEELGGERKFFTKEYERYRWAKLVAPGVSGQDMLNTYSEALTKMVENEGLPPLFRTIFRNAYLPYRDPETLRSFLREINGFTYDHSERLGDAFEYLLSVLGSQGDAGQFRTPRHIIDFMVEIIDPKKTEVVLDPACGTAGFLISAYKHVLKANSTGVVASDGSIQETDVAELALESPLRFPGDQLTPEDRTRLANNIKGYDISPDMVRLSLVNLYLHGFADPKIDEYDTLGSEDKWTETADVILANPPFMSPKGGVRPPHNRFRIQSKRSEVLFVDYIAEHLTPQGRAAIVVPEGIIFQSQSAYVELRKMLVDHFLAAVISLPAGVFNPYSGVKTSILIFDRAVAKASRHLAFFKVENDGFQLGAQRKAQRGTQLPRIKADLSRWLDLARVGNGEDLDSALGFVVPRSTILSEGSVSLSAERYLDREKSKSAYPMVSLGDETIFRVESGGTPKSNTPEYWNGGIAWATLVDLPPANFITEISSTVRTISDRGLKESSAKILPPNSILVSSRATIGRIAINRVSLATNQGFKNIVIADESKAVPEYVALAMTRLVPTMQSWATGGTFAEISKSKFCELEIPLPPVGVQREIVGEIEAYQRVIAGARAVVDHYRPHVPVDPKWPVLPLAEVISGRPKNGYSGQPVNYTTNTKVLSLSATTSGKLDPTKFKYIDEDIAPDAECRCQRGDIYLQRGNTAELVGTAALFDIDEPNFIYPDLMIRVRADESIVSSNYLLAILQSHPIRDFLKGNAAGAAGSMPKINRGIVDRIPIPLPPLAIQEELTSEIEAEQALVEGNRDLIARFEKKIADAISKVWAEASTVAEAA